MAMPDFAAPPPVTPTAGADEKIDMRSAEEHGTGTAPTRLQQMAGVLVSCLVLAFAFLVSSFTARNSDFWLHLATGRLLANGEYRFGVDQFTYTSAEAYWVNHAWLFDLALYWTYQALVGSGLVVLKALSITALAWLLLRVRRPGTDAALPAACALLALLAMSPRLLLQPACASLLLLGLSFYLLWRPHAAEPENPAPV